MSPLRPVVLYVPTSGCANEVKTKNLPLWLQKGSVLYSRPRARDDLTLAGQRGVRAAQVQLRLVHVDHHVAVGTEGRLGGDVADAELLVVVDVGRHRVGAARGRGLSTVMVSVGQIQQREVRRARAADGQRHGLAVVGDGVAADALGVVGGRGRRALEESANAPRRCRPAGASPRRPCRSRSAGCRCRCCRGCCRRCSAGGSRAPGSRRASSSNRGRPTAARWPRRR